MVQSRNKVRRPHSYLRNIRFIQMPLYGSNTPLTRTESAGSFELCSPHIRSNKEPSVPLHSRRCRSKVSMDVGPARSGNRTLVVQSAAITQTQLLPTLALTPNTARCPSLPTPHTHDFRELAYSSLHVTGHYNDIFIILLFRYQ